MKDSTYTTYKKRWWALAVLAISLFIVSLDNTILNVALPTLVRDLHASTSQLQWIVDAYVIVFAGLLLTGGSIGDRYGRKWILFLGLTIFGLGSALSAFASSADLLISTRSLMGIGGAMIMPSTLSILINVFKDPKERAKAIAIWSAVSGLGVAIGPLVGGWLLQHFWWGSIFLVNVPLAIIGLVAGYFIVPNSANPIKAKMDLLGVITSIAGLGMLLGAIIEAPSHGWTSTPILLTFALSAAILIGFFVWESKSTHPMLNIKLFSNPRFSAASIAVSLVFFALFGSLFLVTQYFQFVLGFSALSSGIKTVPMALMISVSAPISVRIVNKVGTKIVVTIGMMMVTIGLVWLGQISSVSTHYGSLALPLLLIGLGMGTTMSPCIEAIMGSLPKESAGVGSAMNSTNMQVGGALGVAILGSIASSKFRSTLHNSLSHHLGPKLLAQVVDIVKSSIGAALVLAHNLRGIKGYQLASIAKDSFVKGMNFSLLLAALIALIAALIAFIFLPATSKGDRLPKNKPTNTL